MYPLTLQHLIVDELSLNVLIDCSYLFGMEIYVFFYLVQEIIHHLLFTFVQLPNIFTELISGSGVLMCTPYGCSVSQYHHH